MPVLDQAPAWFDCAVRQAVDLGNPTFFIGAAICVLAAVVAWFLIGDAPVATTAGAADDERAVEEGEVGAAGLPSSPCRTPSRRPDSSDGCWSC